jgi:hypothetical protein
MAENSYSLKNKKVKGEKIKRARKLYSDNEIKQYLDGYVQVPKDKIWKMIPNGTHIRYYYLINDKPEFKLGGFIKKFVESDKGRFIILSGKHIGSKKPNNWALDMNKIHTLYKRQDQVSNVEIAQLYEELNKMKKLIKQIATMTNTNNQVIETRLANLEKNIK